MADSLPERIGAYQVVSLLGLGGMGEVFLARDDRLRRRVAIKRLRHDKGLTPAMRQRLLREARAVAGISHPSVVQVYDLIEDDGRDCLVLEYVEGKTLTAVLAGGGPLEPALAARLAREIAEGLAAAHAAEIVHRDLKSENVIVTPSGHAKILDFGLARMRALTGEVVLTQHGAVLGTLHTMSPEQANGGEADERSDLFSLGVLLYEMLTGHSPFRGANPLETLRRVISEHPPRADVLRPGIPAQLAAVTEHLLAKDPAARPPSATQAALELETAERSAPSSNPRGFSDTATTLMPGGERGVQTLARSSSAPASTAGLSVIRGKKSLWVFGPALLAVMLLGIATLLLRWPETGPEPPRVQPPRPQPLRIAVPKPAVDSSNERLALAASGVLTASLDALGSLEGLTPVDPLQLQGAPETPVGMARAVAAKEVLVASVEPSGTMARITLRRIRGSDGSVIWTRNFDAPAEPQDLSLLADAVGMNVRQAFPDARPKPGTLALEVRDKDYAEFLAIKQGIDSGSPADLERLEKITQGSPRFLQGWLLASDVALTRFRSSKEIADYDRALALVRRAEELAPADPRPLRMRLKIELAGEQPKVAVATLDRLGKLLPGDPQLLVQRAELAQKEGRNEAALGLLRTAAERVPSWRNLYRLAGAEVTNGKVPEARRHLEKALEISPGNQWVLEELAGIEMRNGDLERAQRIYLDLIDRTPQRQHFTNLGLVRLFQNQYEEAIATFHQALAIEPDHVITTLNLADTELALGRQREAETHYRKILKTLERNRPPGGLSPRDNVIQAQCLARLGKNGEALKLTLEALRQRPEDPDILQAAALIYALVGDRASASVFIQSALEKGLQPRWFKLPAYAPLHADPELRSLL